MAPDVRKKLENDGFVSNATSSSFDVTLEELKELMKNHKQDGVTHLETFGGVVGLCRKLKTDSTNGMLWSCFATTNILKTVLLLMKQCFNLKLFLASVYTRPFAFMRFVLNLFF